MRRATLLVVALSFTPLTACYTWRAESLAPSTTRTGGNPTARITLADSSGIVVYDAQVVADTLYGWHPVNGRPTPLAVPLTDVSMIEVQQFQAGRSIAFCLGVGWLAARLAVLYSLSKFDLSFGTP